MRRKCFLRLFRIDAKRRNLKQNIEIWSERKLERSENKTKRTRKIAIIFASKQNKAKRKQKTPIIFPSKRNEAKQKRKNAIIFASKWNGSKTFSLFFASEAKRNEIRENKAKKHLFRFELKQNEKIGSETKKFWKRNIAKICSVNFAFIGSKKFEAKWSEKKQKQKFCFFTWACETHAKRISFRFEAKTFFCGTGAPYCPRIKFTDTINICRYVHCSKRFSRFPNTYIDMQRMRP